MDDFLEEKLFTGIDELRDRAMIHLENARLGSLSVLCNWRFMEYRSFI